MADEAPETPDAGQPPRGRRSLVKPGALFGSWAFAIPAHFWPALDVLRTERVYQKRPRLVWTQGNPPAYDFHEGDIFRSRSGEHAVQITRVASIDGVRYTAYLLGLKPLWMPMGEGALQPQQFADLLRDGLPGSERRPAFAPAIGHNAPSHCRITYIDADGEESEREITITGAHRSGKQSVLISAMDRTDGRAKTFRADRIALLLDLVTGELVDPASVIALFEIKR